MREKVFINIIKNILNSEFIGDDCAYLKDLGIVVTQDNMVEELHFSRKYATAYQIGYKAVMVNLSDICASGAEPEYLTVGLSLPDNIEDKFIEDFYEGAKNAAGKIKIVGGDLTGGDKIFISITAIGSTSGRKISSRKNAKPGQKVVISGPHGSSGAGLKILLGSYPASLNENEKLELINSHLLPKANTGFSQLVQKYAGDKYAMMDTSDGLADALSTIAQDSNVMIEIDFNKIPHSNAIEKFFDYKDLILYGGEDYELIATLDEPPDGMLVIGEVKKGNGLKINYDTCSETLQRPDIEKNLFKHFKEQT